jgi:signal transduction histidine kinase
MMLFGFSIAVLASRQPVTLQYAPPQYSDILLAFMIGAVVNILFGVFISVPFLRENSPYLIILSDWVVAGAFTFTVLVNPQFYENNQLTSYILAEYFPLGAWLITGILSVIIVGGVFRLGSEWGLVQSAGVIVASALVFTVQNVRAEPSIKIIPVALQLYLPILLLVVLTMIISLVWSNRFDETNSEKYQRMKVATNESLRRFENMRKSAKALSEMGQILNATLNYDRILEACLAISRYILREESNARVVTLALLVEGEDEMVIAKELGLSHLDRKRTFRAKEGILATCLEEKKTQILAEKAHDDPELGELYAFAGIESVIVIPLRVEYETYGMLVFGSTTKNAIHKDQVDTMQALGTQACIALRNAVIVDTLKSEKERIVRMERGMRESLTREIHDIPTQTISALAMQLPLLTRIAKSAPEQLEAEVENLRDISMRFVEELRHAMFTWRPLALESQGLGVSLEQLCQKMQQTYKQPMVSEVDPNAVAYLDQEQQYTLFYLIEEAANNARKHAEAKLIKVKVSLEDSSVVVRIMDNGKGFDVDKMRADYAAGSSFGMVNMRDRTEHVRGFLDMQSVIGKGTTIVVKIPVVLNNQNGTSQTHANRKRLDRPHESPVASPRKTGPLSPLS